MSLTYPSQLDRLRIWLRTVGAVVRRDGPQTNSTGLFVPRQHLADSRRTSAKLWFTHSGQDPRRPVLRRRLGDSSNGRRYVEARRSAIRRRLCRFQFGRRISSGSGHRRLCTAVRFTEMDLLGSAHIWWYSPAHPFPLPSPRLEALFYWTKRPSASASQANIQMCTDPTNFEAASGSA